MTESNQNQINESDLEYLFLGKKRKKKNKALTTIKYSALFLAIAVLVFFAINYQALIKEISFWYSHEYKNNANIGNQSSNISTSRNVTANTLSSNIPSFSDNHILIPAISVDAPVTWMVKNTAYNTNSALENGAIHLLGSAIPGTAGNVFVTGHSSNYIWAPGNYKSVFALLDKLSVGDMIFLKYQNKTYAYKMYEKQVINPGDTSVLEQGQKSILTLMTCTPVGTSLNRLIIKSSQVYPDPRFNSSSSSPQSTNNLPGIR